MRQSFPGFIRLWNPSAKCFESFALKNDRCFSFENQNISNISSMLEGSKVVSFSYRYRFSFTDPFAIIRFFRDFFLISKKKKKPTNVYRKQRKEFKIASDKMFYFFRFRSGTVRDHCSKHTWKQSQSQLKLTSFQKKKRVNSWINKTLKKQNKCKTVPTISLPCVI